MAPKAKAAGAKRGRAPESPQKPAKKAKAADGPKVDPQLKAVIDAVEMATDLPEDCRKMVLVALPESLMVLSTERVACQQTMVRIAGEIVESVEKRLEAEAATAADALTTIQGSKGVLEQKAAEAATAREAADASAAEKATALTEKGAALTEAKSALSERQKEQKAGDAESVQNSKDLETYKGAVEKELVLLRDGTWEKKPEATAAEKIVMKLVASCKLDESLMMVAPKAIIKKPDERGDFDKIAVKTIEEGLTARVAELQKAVDESESSSAARASAVAAAQAAADAAAEAKEKAAADVKEAKAAAKEAAAKLTSANSQLEGHESSVKAAEKEKELKANAVVQFKSHNVAAYAALKDKAKEEGHGHGGHGEGHADGGHGGQGHGEHGHKEEGHGHGHAHKDDGHGHDCGDKDCGGHGEGHADGGHGGHGHGEHGHK